MHKSKDYLLESSKSKLDSYRLMHFYISWPIDEIGIHKRLGFKNKKNILGYIVRIFSRILMEENLGYPLKPDEYILSLSGNMSRIEEILLLNAS